MKVLLRTQRKKLNSRNIRKNNRSNGSSLKFEKELTEENDIDVPKEDNEVLSNWNIVIVNKKIIKGIPKVKKWICLLNLH